MVPKHHVVGVFVPGKPAALFDLESVLTRRDFSSGLIKEGEIPEPEASLAPPVFEDFHLNSINLFLSHNRLYSSVFHKVDFLLLGFKFLPVEGSQGFQPLRDHCHFRNFDARIFTPSFSSQGSFLLKAGHQLLCLGTQVLPLSLLSQKVLLIVCGYRLQHLRVFSEQNLFVVSTGMIHHS